MSLLEHFTNLERKYNLPQGFLARTRAIESSNGTRLQSPTGPRGPFQFTRATATAMGLPLDKRDDEYLSSEAAAKYAGQNTPILQNALGRAPTGAELYYAHQQGGPGAAKLLSQPNLPAALGTAAENIRLNGGDPLQSAGTHFGMFQRKFDNARPANLGAPFLAGPAQPLPASVQGPMPSGATMATAPQAEVPETSKKPLAPVREGGGLLGMAMQDEPISMGDVKTFLGGSEMKAAAKGLEMLAANQAAPPKQMQAPPPMPLLAMDQLINQGNPELMAQMPAFRRRRTQTMVA